MKGLFFLIAWIVTVWSVARGQMITLTSSTPQVDINNTFGVSVSVAGVANPGQVEIQGIDQFTVRGQATSTSMQITNGQQSAQITLQLQLQPTATGSFVIGPARLQGVSGAVASNTVTIEVQGEKVFLNPQQGSAILPVQEEQQTVGDQSSVHQSSSSLIWRLLGVLLLLGSGILLRKGKKRRSEQEDIPQLQKDAIGASVLPSLPSKDAPDFREQMDYWWRMVLAKQFSDKHVFTAGYEEVMQLSMYCNPLLKQFFIEAFEHIRDARYAGVDGGREELIALSKKVLTMIII